MAPQDAARDVRPLLDFRQPRRLRAVGARRREHVNIARLQQPFTVAAPRRLHDGLQPRLGAPDDRKIDVDAGLDQRGGD